MNPQRNPGTPRITELGSLTREHLVDLQTKRDVDSIKNLRDSHHMVARLIATGLSNIDVAARTGYSVQRICQLKSTPAVAELIESYRSQVSAAWLDSVDVVFDSIAQAEAKAWRHIVDRLDEEGETLPIHRLLSVAADASDRTGHMKKSVNVNVNVDFAAKLEAARRRSATAGAQPLLLESERSAG